MMETLKEQLERLNKKLSEQGWQKCRKCGEEWAVLYRKDCCPNCAPKPQPEIKVFKNDAPIKKGWIDKWDENEEPTR